MKHVSSSSIYNILITLYKRYAKPTRIAVQDGDISARIAFAQVKQLRPRHFQKYL